MAHFRELTEEIRQEAIVKGMAVERDWEGDLATSGGPRHQHVGTATCVSLVYWGEKDV